jgi:hypothetical protein
MVRSMNELERVDGANHCEPFVARSAPTKTRVNL